MKKIAFSGTLDPITNGHMWVIEEARSLADEVTVFLSENSAKRPQFPAEKRKQIIEQSAAERGWHNVRVIIVKGDYTARAAKKHGIDYLIRGIRNTADFDYENLIQQTNVDVLHGAKTIFVMPPRDLGSVSSSFVAMLQGPVGWNWNVSKFIPGPAHRAWLLEWLRKEWEALWQYSAASVTPQAIRQADEWFERLIGDTSYGGSLRHYRNLDHLVHGLTEIRVWGLNTAATPEALVLLKKAFWFHDGVYGGECRNLGSKRAANRGANDKKGATAASAAATAASDVERSACLWLESGLDPAAADQVADLIRATDHSREPAVAHPLKDTIQSVDLAIFGQEEDVYDMYAQAVRDEQSQVPDAEYRPWRMRVMTQLRDRAAAGRLYRDPYFATQYNRSAIANLSREIGRLEDLPGA
jgi:pantetheine-phosphate adenylyltransferase